MKKIFKKTADSTSTTATRAQEGSFFKKASGGVFFEGAKQYIQRKREKQEDQQDLDFPTTIWVPEGFHALTIYSSKGNKVYETERKDDDKEDFSKRIETHQFKIGEYSIVFKLGNKKTFTSEKTFKRKFVILGGKTTLIIKSKYTSKEDKNKHDKDKIDNIIIMPYGEWYTVGLGLVKDKSKSRYSIETYIVFKPNEKVDAKQIGIIQSATAKSPLGVVPPKSVQNEKGNIFPNAQIEKRATEEGIFIDQTAESINPLYASKGGAGPGQTH